jgi:GT2 family glycosyltransferase
MPSVLIVILNWNGLEDTIDCVRSALKQTYIDFHVLVIDNNSKHKPSHQHPVLKDSRVDLIYNKTNKGFAGGVNTGIKYGLSHNYDFIALVNNDAILQEDWLQKVTLNLINSNYSIGAGLLLSEDGTYIDSAGEEMSIWGISFPRLRNRPISTAKESGPVFGSTGGAVVYKSQLFRDIGLFDESFFAYYEDADINFRAQLRGYKAFYSNEAIAYHKGGVSSKKIPGFTVYQTFKNLPLLFWKNTPTLLLPVIGIRFLVLYTLIFTKAIFNKSGWFALKGLLASVYYFWTSALWKRLSIQYHRKVSTKYIWSILYHDLPPEQTGMRKFRKLFTGKN